MLQLANEKHEHGVPRRFSIGTLLLLLTLFALLIRLLTLAYAPVPVVACVAIFFVSIAVGQSFLFAGEHPRAASIIVGAIVSPSILFAFAIDQSFTNWFGISPLVSFDKPGQFASTCVILSMLGMLMGYIAGGLIASTFLILSGLRSKPAAEKSRRSTDSTGFQTARAVAQFARRWVLPYQPRTPLRGAIATIFLCTAISTLVTPFFALPSLIASLRFGLLVGCVLALLSGNFQLAFRWPLLFVALGALAAVYPYQTLLDVAFIRMNFSQAYDVWQIALRVAVLATGGLTGATLTALLGWSEWIRSNRNSRAVPPIRRLVILGFTLFGVTVFSTYQINRWATSPRQAVLTRVLDRGGTLYSWFPVETRLRRIEFAGDLTDDDVIEVMSMFDSNNQTDHPSQITLQGPNFTNRAVASLDGFQLETFDLTGAGITDNAFDELHDFSSVCFVLKDTNAGDKLAEQIGRFQRTKAVVEYLNLSGTNVSDDGMTHLGVCKSLTTLDCTDCEIGDEGIIGLGKMPNLRLITLTGTQIGDAALKHLATAAPQLTGVIVDKTAVTDVGLNELKKLPSLLFVRCLNTNVTDNGVTSLRVANKSCGVQWDPNESNQMPEYTDSSGRFEAIRLRWMLNVHALQPYQFQQPQAN